MNNEDKILIEIASYCDSELLNTVNSALIQADFPNRIYFAICYQSDNLEDYDKLKKIENCKVTYMSEKEAKGSVYARYLCQQMIEDEKYIYQIDAHMRFVKHWDTKIISQLESLNDNKAILSTYPPSCTEEMMQLPLDDKVYDTPADGGVMYTNGFRDSSSYFLQCRSIPIKNNDVRAYKRNAFVAAGNFFTYSEAHKEVFYDKEMYFYGDELPMAIRLFTYGWNVYNPGESYVYHQYERKSQKFPPVTDAMKNENIRFMNLLNLNDGIDIGNFGLGTVRTLNEYEEFSGIDFRNKIVYMKAENGCFESSQLDKKISYCQQKKIEQYNLITKKETIDVLVIDLFNEYKECVISCLSKSYDSNYINFIIATNDNIDADFCKQYNIKKCIPFPKNVNYTKLLSELTQFISNDYVMIIDSSYRFIFEWDKYLCENIKMCGEYSALTSWIWCSEKELLENDLHQYTNVVKDFSHFNNYLPVLKYNQKINISRRKSPYQTAFISDGFLFCKSDVIKKVPIDPNLTYEEHQFIYSARLWTNGINLYYPLISYMIKTKNSILLNDGVKNLQILCSIMGINNYFYEPLNQYYEYDHGNVRPLWSWYDFAQINYDASANKIIL